MWFARTQDGWVRECASRENTQTRRRRRGDANMARPDARTQKLACIALSGEGRPNAVATDSIASAANEVLSWKDRKLRMLKKMPLPSATACVRVAKSSSARIMSAASLATSVPPLPMAMPMSAAWDITPWGIELKEKAGIMFCQYTNSESEGRQSGENN